MTHMEYAQKKTLEMLLPNYSASPELIVPRGTIPEELSAEIDVSDNIKYLLAGQRGMGKTTELKRLVGILEGTDIIPVFVQFGSQDGITHPMLIDAMANDRVKSPLGSCQSLQKVQKYNWPYYIQLFFQP